MFTMRTVYLIDNFKILTADKMNFIVQECFSFTKRLIQLLNEFQNLLAT